ncbi:MAG: hypothetical protein PW843_11245 [Azospirillaceae bacterium]|nr:hypothetical protein [Azospirillaceae bacterium]
MLNRFPSSFDFNSADAETTEDRPVKNGIRTLSDWSLDEPFINEIRSLSARCDIVSLDIFDTALTRLVDSPADTFAEMERRLILQFGPMAKGFATEREEAERDARKRQQRLKGAEEVTFQQIYTEIGQRMPALAPHLEIARQVELEVERDILVAVPDILELTRRLAVIGKPYIFVSDMYLPADFLADVLAGCGYTGWQALHVSCETMATKSGGRQWDVVKTRHPQASRFLHIGDDDWSDGRTAREHGIEARIYLRARSERRLAGPLTPACLPFSRFRRATVLNARADFQAPETSADYWRGVGRTLGGIVVGGYIRWLAQRVKLHGIRRLYFCARDGWLMHQAWQAANLARETGVEDQYFHTSRRPLNLAQGYMESTPHRLSPGLLEFLHNNVDDRVTVRLALARADLLGEAALVEDCATRFGSLDVPLDAPEFDALLQRHSAAVHARMAPAYEGLRGYLEQERLDCDGRSAIVDMGWNATMQRCLRLILERMHGKARLSGFYYGLWSNALSNRYGAGLMEAAFGNEFRPTGQQFQLHSAVDILEELHAAPHGTVHSYAWKAGRWHPVLAENPVEKAQYEAITRHFQDGALETVTELFATGACGPLTLDDLTPAAARAAMAAFSVAPSKHDLMMFGRIGHCATFDHAHLDGIIATTLPTGEEAMRKALTGGWSMGTLKYWSANGSADQRELVRTLARENFSHYGARALRQFD